MIGHWAAALVVAAALAGTAEAGQGDRPAGHQRSLRVFPSYLYLLPPPMFHPLPVLQDFR
jgi:hypothetical protein